MFKSSNLLEMLGIHPNKTTPQIEKIAGISLPSALMKGILELVQLGVFFLSVLKLLFSGVLPFFLLLGPIGFFNSLMNSFMQGLTVYFYFIANLNLAVATINLFPIPTLDGGLILYAVIEKIRKKPMSIALEVLIHRLINILLWLTFIQLVLNDLKRFA